MAQAVVAETLGAEQPERDSKASDSFVMRHAP